MTAIKKHYIAIIFIVAAIAQIAVPASLIARYMDVLHNGIVYKVKTMPIDPVDPFRGRYVAISMDLDVPDALVKKFHELDNSSYYIKLDEGVDGFAKISQLSGTPIKGDGVIKLRGSRWRFSNSIRLPYNRYYMDENAAPKAEATASSRRGETYAALKVKGGAAVIKGLYINGLRIEDYK